MLSPDADLVTSQLATQDLIATGHRKIRELADDLVVIGKVVQNIVNLRGPSPVHVNSRVTRDLPVSYDSNLFYTRLTPKLMST